MQKGRDYIGAGVGVMIFNSSGEVLLCKRGQATKNERGCWECPGGGIEFGETMVEAVRREIKEELGVDVRIAYQLLAVDHLIPAEGQHWVTIPFVAKITSGQTPKVMEPHKCDEIGWFRLSNLPKPLSIATQLNLVRYREYAKSL
jgi:8-oxo-dGTP diphosphatase